jgi:hypothetical protein
MLTWWMPAGAPAMLKLAGILPLLWSLAMPTYPTQEKCCEVKPGMTESEALDILGSGLDWQASFGDFKWVTRLYKAEGGFVCLTLGLEDRVTGCTFTPESPSLLDRLRDWFADNDVDPPAQVPMLVD